MNTAQVAQATPDVQEEYGNPTTMPNIITKIFLTKPSRAEGSAI